LELRNLKLRNWEFVKYWQFAQYKEFVNLGTQDFWNLENLCHSKDWGICVIEYLGSLKKWRFGEF
jgi:hypothetical protein